MSHIIQDHSVMHHERNMTHVHVGFENIGTEKHEMTILLTHSYLYYRDEFIENGYAISSL